MVGRCATGVMALLVCVAADVFADEAPVLQTPDQMMSYTLGVDLARNLRRQGLDCDTKLLIRGLQDALTNAPLLISEREFRLALSDVQTRVRRNQALTRGRPAAEAARIRSETYLRTNQLKEGVTCLTNGVQYRVLHAGAGRKPMPADTVECRYRGTLIDGTEIATSGTEHPAVFPVQAPMVPCLSEALPLMPAGSKWQFVIPPALAAKMHGADLLMPTNDLLVVELELLSVK